MPPLSRPFSSQDHRDSFLGGLFIYTPTSKKGGIPIGFYIGIMLLNIYISQHGDELNFLDISLITTAVCIAIGMVITQRPSNDKH